jgi:hypothetical protein
MHVGVWIFGLLALASLASVLARRPWTSVAARRHNPPEVWSTDLFRETNMLISGTWSLLFGGAALLAALAPLWINLGYGALLAALGHFSARIGAWYSSRRLRAMGIAGDGSP